MFDEEATTNTQDGERRRGEQTEHELIHSIEEIAIDSHFAFSDLKIRPSPSKILSGHSDDVCKVLFLPSGRLVSCSRDKTIRVWDISTGEELFQLTGHTHFVHSLAILPNGWLASGSADHTIKLWDLDQRKEVRTFQGHTREVVSLRVLKNGHLVSYSLDDTLRIWNPMLQENNLRHTIEGHGNNTWLPLFGVLSNDSLVTCSLDIDGTKESVLTVHDPTDGQIIKFLPTGRDDAWSLLVLSNDQLAVGFLSGSITIFDLNIGETQLIYQAHDSYVSSLFQLSNGYLVSSGTGWNGRKAMIKIWNLYDSSLLQSVDPDHSRLVYSIDVSKDETFLATGSDDNSIKLWPIE